MTTKRRVESGRATAEERVFDTRTSSSIDAARLIAIAVPIVFKILPSMFRRKAS